jgi:hypothetical protein
MSVKQFHYTPMEAQGGEGGIAPTAGVAWSVECLTTNWITMRLGFDPCHRQRIFPLCPDRL